MKQDQISDLEDKVAESINQSKGGICFLINKNEDTLRDLWDNISITYISMKYQKEKKKL